ncbi:MAG: hypothetical protein WAT66_02545, partial [Actinomycetota bacterium]
AGTGGTGGRNSTGGSGGVAGSGGAAGSGGSGGTGGISDSGSDSDAGIDAYVDASTPDAANLTSFPYEFRFRHGTTNISHYLGRGTLSFSGTNNCELKDGYFNVESVEDASKFPLTIDLAGSQSINFCGSQVTLPFASGIFNGVSVMLSNISDPLTSKDHYQIVSCSPQGDGGVALENCQGSLDRVTQ